MTHIKNFSQTSTTLHNSTQVYTTVHNSTQVYTTNQHNFAQLKRTLQNFTTPYNSTRLKQTLCNMFTQSFTNTKRYATLRNKRHKLHKTIRSFTNLYKNKLDTTVHDSTTLYITLHKLYKLFHDFTQPCTTLQLYTTFTTTLQKQNLPNTFPRLSPKNPNTFPNK